MAKAASAPNARSPRTLENQRLLSALRAFRKGDFSVRLPANISGVEGEIADAFNDVVELNERMTKELERLGDQVGKQGKIGERARLPNSLGSWSANVDTVNSLIADLIAPTAEMARVVGAVARGDLGQTMNLEIEGRPLKGEFLRSGKVVNTMVDQLGSFVSEVTRVAREVGTEGKLGGQARVKGVAGTWKDLTDNVNAMAANLTGTGAQHRRSDDRGGQRRPLQEDHRGREGRGAGAEIHHQHDGGPVELIRFRSDARGARSGHRRKARRPGQREGRRRHLEGPDRQREPDGRQPDRPGAQHRRRDDRGGEGRPLQEDHGGRERRNPRAEEHHQHDGGPAELVRLRSDARGARSGHRRQARRPGQGERRRRHLERPDRQREPDGREPDRSGAQHRRSDHRGGHGRPVQEDHRGRARAKFST